MNLEMYIIAAVLVLVPSFFLFGFLTRKKTKQSPDLHSQAIENKHLRFEKASTPEKLKTLEEALANTKRGLFGKLGQVFSNSTEISSTQLEEVEEMLYTSDLGPKTVQRFLASLESQNQKWTLDSVKSLFRNEMSQILKSTVSKLDFINGDKPDQKPQVWMIVGVNGVGKTTTIGKISHKLAGLGLKTMIAAGDTFRAAAKDQLQVWAERSGVTYFSPPGIDSPSAVAFEAVKKAKQEQFDILVIDTAGRLHTQDHLMEELKKVKRVINNQESAAPHEILIVLDANSGQNALIQARQFHQTLGLTGVVLTKLDGTAKGGVAIGIVNELNIPIKLIGVGEKIEDLRPFNSQEFIDSIL